MTYSIFAFGEEVFLVQCISECQSKGPYETNRDEKNEIDLDIYVSDSDKPPVYVTDEECHLGH